MAGFSRIAPMVCKTTQGYTQTKAKLRSPALGTQESSRAMNRGMMHKASAAARQLPRGVCS